MTKLKTLFLSALLFALPALVHGQDSIKTIFDDVYDLLLLTVPLMIGLGVFFFVFASSQFIWEAGNTDERQKRRFLFFWGVIALTIAVSVDLIITMLIRTFFG